MIATDKEWKNKHEGEECLIIGGGYREKIEKRHVIINPYEYLRNKQLDKYPHKVFGCNSAFYVRKLDFIVLKDPWVWEKYKEEYTELEIPIFYIGAKEDSIDYITVGKSVLPRAGTSFKEGVCSYLSGYCAVHLALLLGFRKIYLSGFSGGVEMLTSLSHNFIFFTEWISEYGREIYITEKNSLLKGIFKYEKPPSL